MMTKFHSFVRNVVLTPFTVDQKIREQALNLLLEYEQRPTQPEPRKVYTSPPGKIGTKVTVTKWASKYIPGTDQSTYSTVGSITMPRHMYNEVCNLVTENRRIDAIRLLRDDGVMGLKEAKDTLDKWDFNL